MIARLRDRVGDVDLDDREIIVFDSGLLSISVLGERVEFETISFCRVEFDRNGLKIGYYSHFNI